MKVLILSNGADNGGVGIAIKRAFDRSPELGVEVRSVTRAQNFIGFEPDVFWPPAGDSAGVDILYRAADVVHVMDKFEAVKAIPSCEGLGTKPTVMHHHGSIFRSKPEGFLDECRNLGILQLVATFDLLAISPGELEWLPHPIDIELMQEFRRGARNRGGQRVIHTPGAGDNGTDALLRAYNESSGWTTDIVRGVPWATCMRRKAAGDILFDSFGVGYGMTSVEAFAMRIPVISGADAETETRIREHLGVVPYYSSTSETIGNAVEMMVSDSTLRAELADIAWEVVNQHHAERRVALKLRDVYERAIG